jgi:VIT1/CCC1 family predicted Fe2+/Mn2+ transporter
VHSQEDAEQADQAREALELREDPLGERRELAGIYAARGLDPVLADQVAGQLMAHDALGAHTRDELGFSEITAARPLQAAVTSAASFALGAALPIGVVLLSPAASMIAWVSVTSLIFLAVLGAVSAQAGGSALWRGAWRVTFWGTAAMAVTAGAGALFGAVT